MCEAQSYPREVHRSELFLRYTLRIVKCAIVRCTVRYPQHVLRVLQAAPPSQNTGITSGGNSALVRDGAPLSPASPWQPLLCFLSS